MAARYRAPIRVAGSPIIRSSIGIGPARVGDSVQSVKMSSLFFVVLFSMLPALAAAQDGPPIDGPAPPTPPEVVARDARGRITVRAVELKEGLVVDGLLNEPIYSQVPALSDFVQQEPHEGEAATERTEVWIFFDERNIYFAARCIDSQPDRIVANEMRRDHTNILQDDNFDVAIDTFYDRRSGFAFMTNPLGALRETEITDERTRNADWNTVWGVKTARNGEGWTVEIVIPFKSLRYKTAGPQVWGLNLRRIVQSKNEHSFLAGVPAALGRQGLFRFSGAATLVGVRVPALGNNLEVKPYAVAALTTNRVATPPISNDPSRDFGFDVKYGVTKRLTADFTVNTDFAQVEEDEQQVNLTRFTLFFPDKREFFLEGRGIFAFGGAQQSNQGGGDPGAAPTLIPNVFFSRRIGLASGGQVPILAGGRLTGHTDSRTTIGILNVQTKAASKAVATSFTVVRVRRDILRRSTIGLIGTQRSPRTTGTDSNQVFGADAALAFYENVAINAYYARNQTPGLSGDRSSRLAQFAYAADRYGLNLEHLQVGDAFQPEVGFLRRERFRRNYAAARFSPRPRQSRSIRQLNWDGRLDYITDLDGRLESREARGSFGVDFNSGDTWTTEYTRSYELLVKPFAIDTGVTDVVVPSGGYGFQNLRSSYNLAGSRLVSGRLTVARGGFYGGTRTEAGYQGRVDFGSQFSIEPRLTIDWVRLPVGEFTTKLVGTRTTFTLTPRMAVSALLQYNSTTTALSSNVRFRWEYQSGSDLFVVYSDGRNTVGSGFPTLENRALVVKATRLFRF